MLCVRSRLKAALDAVWPAIAFVHGDSCMLLRPLWGPCARPCVWTLHTVEGSPKPVPACGLISRLGAQINLEFPVQLPSRLHEKFPRASGLLGPDKPGSLSDKGLDLLRGLLRLDPAQRLTAAQAQDHPW